MKIFIGSSSRVEIDNSYVEDSIYIANKLSKWYDLNMGGLIDGGMMGNVTEIFLNNNREVTIYTLKLYGEDFSKFRGNYKYFDNTFMRTSNLYYDSDKILFLPGGSGTFAEIFGMLEDIRTIDNNKEMIIYNKDNYYTDIIKLLNKAVKNKFNDINILDYIKVFNDKDDLIKYLEVK